MTKVLEGQLREYSAAVSAAARKLHAQIGNWPIYAAATGSALAMATSASANTIVSAIGTSGSPLASVSVPGQSGTAAIGLELNIHTTSKFGHLGTSASAITLQVQRRPALFGGVTSGAVLFPVGAHGAVAGSATTYGNVARRFLPGSSISGPFLSSNVRFKSATNSGFAKGTSRQTNLSFLVFGWLRMNWGGSRSSSAMMPMESRKAWK